MSDGETRMLQRFCCALGAMSNANGSDTLIVLERGAFSLRGKYNVDDSRDVQAFVGRLVVL